MSVSRSSSSNAISYAYDLRGWLTNISTSTFTEELFYADSPGTALYNGNISSIRWKDNTQSSKRGYKFSYDSTNRLTSGAYGEGDALSSNTNRYSESMSYDANGNITGLTRYGNSTLMDNLTISYTGNQPTSVSESASDNNVSGAMEYKKANGSGYKFNANGSLVADKSRGIAYITYDYNNNPKQIYFTNGSVTKYVYSASGQKLRAVHYTVKPNITRTWGEKPAELTVAQILLADSTDYLMGGSLTMKNGKIDKYLFGGGYAQASVASSTTDNFAFYYYNQDHLGNIREVVDASGNVQQVTNYYPFGAPYADASGSTNSDFQPYKYNGKELDKMHGLNTYDYGARQYDPILARWDRIDPLCEKYYGTSPYVYCHDNPVNRVDPDGKDDYFNSAGSFMYSTSNGSDVYVNNVLITDVSLNNDASRQAVANVVGYYANEAGISYYVKGGKSVGDSPSGTVGLAYHSNKDTFAFTRGNDIYVNKSGGHINSYLHDKYNIISTFEHEKEHKNNGHGFGGMTNRAHASVYAKHIGSKTFSKTTKDYQNVVVNSFIEMLKKSITEGATDKVIMSLISDANKGLSGTGMQIVYRRTGSDTDSYNLEVVK